MCVHRREPRDQALPALAFRRRRLVARTPLGGGHARHHLIDVGATAGLFAGAMKLSEAAESAKEKQTEEKPEEEPEAEPAPDEGKA